MVERHYRVVIDVRRYPWGVEGKVKEVVQKYFNLDNEPRFLYGKKSGKLRAISLRLRYDDPLVSFKKPQEIDDRQLCNAFMDAVLQFIEDLMIKASMVEIYETITYGPEGLSIGTTSGSSNELTAEAILAALGGVLGYLIGDKYEAVTRPICSRII